MQDLYCSSQLLTALSPLPHPSVFVFEEIDSTNLEARRRFLEGDCGYTLLLANRQTAGRGRLGRSFHSPSAGIYLSLLAPVDPNTLVSSVSVTCAASVAVRRAISDTTGKQTQIKWVNDLYHNGKKVCGILTEAVTIGDRAALIVGIGINLRPTNFPDDLQQIAGSLNETTVSRTTVVSSLLHHLIPFLTNPSDHSWLEDYRSASCVLGKPVSWTENGVTQTGTALSIHEDGALSVRDNSGSLHLLRTGEISLRALEN
ncbi:MAG: biotin--[acetyl-CoA-carboxylase] ligase [Ruminococcaceae bacterium]|nr:biotin--[acetyl-CoA-carboxylase] ligase [Oscillospiraceae bacterium]